MFPLAVWLLGIIAVLLGVIWSTFFIPTLRQVLLLRKLPGPLCPPVLGVGYELPFVKTRDILEYLRKKAIDTYERVAGIWLIGLPMVFINSPRDIEVILSSPKYIEKGEEYMTLRPWLQEGLLTSKGKKWQMRRKILTPTFHFKILEDKSSTMFDNAQKFVDKLLEENGRPFDPMSKVSRCTLDIISESAMGVCLNSQDHNPLSSNYVSAISRITEAVTYRVLNLYLHRQWLWEIHPVGSSSLKDVKLLHDFTNKIIADRREAYMANRTEDDEQNDIGEKKKPAFLDKLLELSISKKVELSNSDIREEVDTFMFEGHDTTACAVEYAIFELGHHSDVQETAFREQYEIFGDSPREATLADIQRMNYLERVIKEVLRLYPSVPYFSRKLPEDVHLDGLPVIPRGSNIVITPYYLHRNPLYYSNPNEFDPDRFLPDECSKRHPFAYIPFSAGPRNCIGQKYAMMELKVILSSLLRRTKIESLTPRNELKLAPLTILRSLSPVNIRVSPRGQQGI